VGKSWEDLLRRYPSRLYVVGGLDSGYNPVDTAHRFDPLNGFWEALPPLECPRAGPCAAVAAGRLYVLGGEYCGRALQSAQRFDPWMGCWESLPDMSTGRIRAAAVFCGGFLYVLGGLDGSKPLNSAERYSPKTRKWEELPSMHRPRYACTAAVQGHRILAFGGELTDAGNFASIERYDPEADEWELLPAVGAPCCGAAVALGNSSRAAFTLGGLGLSGQALGVAEQLALDELLEDPEATEANQFDMMPSWGPLRAMPTPRHLTSATTYRGGAVAVGGKGPTFEAVSSVELFNPEIGSWEVLPSLPSPRFRAAVVGGRL
jgi:hypothetical protein